MTTTRQPRQRQRSRTRSRSGSDLERRRRIAREQLYGGIPSPCIGVCRLDERSNVCIGCYRLDSEISGWFELNDEQRRAVLAKAGKRRATLNLPGA